MAELEMSGQRKSGGTPDAQDLFDIWQFTDEQLDQVHQILEACEGHLAEVHDALIEQKSARLLLDPEHSRGQVKRNLIDLVAAIATLQRVVEACDGAR